MFRVETFESGEVSDATLNEFHALCVRAFDGDFDPDDWDHALGGRHFVAYEADRPVAHASVVPRTLEVDGRRLRTGYVEAVATEPDMSGQGIGSLVMAEVTWWIPDVYEMGALGTGSFSFYERLGWERWQGTSFVRVSSSDLRRSPEDDDAIMVFRFGPSSNLDLAGAIVCEARAGDDW